MTAFRMKVLVGSVRKVVNEDGLLTSEEVAMQAVYGRDGSANAQWCKWTPYIDYKFTISNPAAFNKILPGQFYYVDLTETEKDSL